MAAADPRLACKLGALPRSWSFLSGRRGFTALGARSLRARESHECHRVADRLVVSVGGLDEPVDVVDLLEDPRVLRSLDGEERALEPIERLGGQARARA